MKRLIQRGGFLRLIGSAITMQALLSASSFLVGIILIRHAASAQYGYYVLVINAIMLLSVLQNSFVQPQLVPRIARATQPQRADLVGGAFRDQRRLWPIPALSCAVAAVLLRLAGRIDTNLVLLLLAAGAALYTALFREFFRMILLGNRRPYDVIKGDIAFISLSIAGAWLATQSPLPAVFAVGGLALAAYAGGHICARNLSRTEPWNIAGAPGILRAIAPLGAWSAAGGIIHWLFTQGYSYVTAATLDMNAVAEIAATRLLIMPVNLLSTGIGTMMLPTISGWLDRHTGRTILRRIFLFTLALAAIALVYFLAVWLLRDWIFTHVFKKQFPDRDVLLALWFAVGILMLFRDQLIYLLIVRERFHRLTLMTLLCAVVGLTISYVGMRQHGAPGALIGVLCGELLTVFGIFVFSGLEARARHDRSTTPMTSR